MTFTDKFDLEETSYSQSGWNAVVWANFQKVDAGLDSRLPVLVAGEAVDQHEAVYLNPSTGKVELAQADGSQQPCIGLAVEAADTDEEIRIQREGAVTNAGWSWTVGGVVYLSSSTPGGLTQTPTSPNRQIIGYALTATCLVIERERPVTV
jgi:hypothetical protein